MMKESSRDKQFIINLKIDSNHYTSLQPTSASLRRLRPGVGR
jgi:hypothetical protein